MSATSLLIIFCGAWWKLSLAGHIGSVVAALLQPMLRSRKATRRDQPPISVIVPVNRVHRELELAFVSLFSQTYPRLEVLVSAADDSCPALEIARSVAARFPGINSRIIAQRANVAASPKLNNLVTPLALADYELLAVMDSNVRIAEDQLAEMVGYLIPGVGLVCAVPIAVGPATFAADIECTLINGHARLLLAASAFGWGFGYGKLMMFDRRDFSRAGGVPEIAGSIGEDHALSKALARIGLKTVFAATVVRQTAGRRNFYDIWHRQLRWMMVRRLEAPLAFYLEPFFSCLFTTCVGAIGASRVGAPWWIVAAATPVLWCGLEMLFARAKSCSLSWRLPLAFLCREFMIPALWVQTWKSKAVYWDNLRLDVRADRAF